jgi:D-aminopeptidase
MAKPRGRDLGLPFPGATGANNAITDVPGTALWYKGAVRCAAG